MPVDHELTTLPLLLFLASFATICVASWKRGIAVPPPPATSDD